MSSIKLLGETSGEVVLKAPAVAGASEVTLPTGTVDLANYVTADGTATFTNKSGNISQWTNDSGYMTATYTGNLNITGKGTFSGAGSFEALELITSDTNRVYITGNSSASGDMWRIGTNNSNPHLNISTLQANSHISFNTPNGEDMRLEDNGDLHVDGDVIAFSTTISDVALKSDIEMIPNALDKIDDVRGVTFTRHNGQKSAGIIAQELEKVLPCAVREKTLALVDGKKYKTVEYDAIHGLLINCIKELKKEIKELKDAFTK